MYGHGHRIGPRIQRRQPRLSPGTRAMYVAESIHAEGLLLTSATWIRYHGTETDTTQQALVRQALNTIIAREQDTARNA